MEKENSNIYSKILASGSYHPKKVVTNDDFAKKLDTTNEWIVERTGIESRYFVENENSSDLGFYAAKNALESANLQPSDIDLIITATSTPDKNLPATACLIAAKLKTPNIACFDVQSACSGFIYGLSVADLFIKTGKSKKALVIGAETMSKLMNMEDRGTCILFGDGAGAFVLGASETPGIIDTRLHSMPKYTSLLFSEKIRGEEKLVMKGREVFKIAVKELCDMAPKILEENGFKNSDLDWFVPHQANIRIIDAVQKKLNLDSSKVITTIDEYGNTSAASIPQAFDFANKQEKFKKGDLILLEAFGAGFSWGSVLLKI